MKYHHPVVENHVIKHKRQCVEKIVPCLNLHMLTDIKKVNIRIAAIVIEIHLHSKAACVIRKQVSVSMSIRYLPILVTCTVGNFRIRTWERGIAHSAIHHNIRLVRGIFIWPHTLCCKLVDIPLKAESKSTDRICTQSHHLPLSLIYIYNNKTLRIFQPLLCKILKTFFVKTQIFTDKHL